MSHAILSEERYLRSSTVVSRELDGETLVVPIRGGVGDLNAIFSFNALGSDLWTLLEKQQSLNEMVNWVLDRYEVTREQAVQDIRVFLSELTEAGLVRAEEIAS